MNNSAGENERLADRFVTSLIQLAEKEDRATLARLRRGLGKEFGFSSERDGWVIARVPQKLQDSALSAYCLIASLFALHSVAGEGTMGAAFRRLWVDGDESQSVERRFVVLLDSDGEDLPERLRQAISLLKAKGKERVIAFDWAQLLRDVQWWDHEDRCVRKRWAKDFWGGQALQEQDAA